MPYSGTMKGVTQYRCHKHYSWLYNNYKKSCVGDYNKEVGHTKSENLNPPVSLISLKPPFTSTRFL